MPFWLHLATAVILLGYFIYNYVKHKYFYYILFMVWIATTFLKYPFASSRPLTIGLGLFQMLMFVVVVYLMFKRSGEQRTRTLEMIAKMSADKLDTESDDKTETAEKIADDKTETAEKIAD
ncbi:MAG: hypothetical protein RSA99_06195 [Oscillospiraceae bacterium]